jgi:hypothetical protein
MKFNWTPFIFLALIPPSPLGSTKPKTKIYVIGTKRSGKARFILASVMASPLVSNKTNNVIQKAMQVHIWNILMWGFLVSTEVEELFFATYRKLSRI